METLLSLPIPSSSTAKDWVPAEEREGGEGRVNILRAFFFLSLFICLFVYCSFVLYFFIFLFGYYRWIRFVCVLRFFFVFFERFRSSLILYCLWCKRG